jgi:hypothetical protein
MEFQTEFPQASHSLSYHPQLLPAGHETPKFNPILSSSSFFSTFLHPTVAGQLFLSH